MSTIALKESSVAGPPVRWGQQLWRWVVFLFTFPLWVFLYLHLILWIYSEVMTPVFGWLDWFPPEARLQLREWAWSSMLQGISQLGF